FRGCPRRAHRRGDGERSGHGRAAATAAARARGDGAEGAHVRLGLLPTANIARQILRAAATTPAVDVVAVGSRGALRAQAYALEHAIARPYGSYEELLADPDVDGVYIALPNSLHHEWSLRSLAAGKHVLCEKPYSRRPHEVEEGFAAAEQAGLVLM